jgi:ABC-2 type transport system ATP-binding protein
MRKTVLDELNLMLEEGKIYGLLGPNGSGKTTLMKIMAGLLRPTSGKIEILGNEVGTKTKGIVSFMPTINHLPRWMKVKQCIGYYGDFFGDFDLNKANAMTEFMGLKGEQKVEDLSTGLLGRFKITLAICRDAKLYVLDEPLNGLDPVSREKVMEAILTAGQEDNTIIISSHLIKEFEATIDEVLFLDQGKVVLSGNAEELRLNRGLSIDELYREVYGND